MQVHPIAQGPQLQSPFLQLCSKSIVTRNAQRTPVMSMLQVLHYWTILSSVVAGIELWIAGTQPLINTSISVKISTAMIFEFLFWLADHFPPTPGSKRLRTAVQLDCIIVCCPMTFVSMGLVLYLTIIYTCCAYIVVLQYYKTKLTSPTCMRKAQQIDLVHSKFKLL